MNAIFLLFINDMDEQFMDWMGKRYLDIKEVMIEKSPHNPESSDSHRRPNIVRMEKFRFDGTSNNLNIEPSGENVTLDLSTS